MLHSDVSPSDFDYDYDEEEDDDNDDGGGGSDGGDDDAGGVAQYWYGTLGVVFRVLSSPSWFELAMVVSSGIQ